MITEIRATEGEEGRLIYFRRIGEQFWSLEEARIIHTKLTEALLRADDPTPIPPVYKPSPPEVRLKPARSPREPRPSTDQLLDLI